jgi:HK97 family phage portal protein
MKLFSKKNIVEQIRANPAGFVMFFENQAFSNSMKLQEYIKEGYRANVIVYKCVKEVSTCLAGVALELWETNKDKTKEKYITNHPLLDLLARPNPIQSGRNFMRELVTNYLVTGNSYIIKDTEDNKPPKELWPIPTAKVKVVASKSGMPKTYEIETMKINVDQTTGSSRLLHIRDISIDGELIGMSALEPAAISADLHNAALRWNYSLLRNGAKTPYAITGKDGAELNAEQKAAVVEWWNKAYQGENNAGKPIILSGIDVKPIGLSPVDMDYKETVREAANNICLAFGVPPVMVTGEGNTYNNMKEARESFYENTILPLLDEILAELNRWLVKQYGSNLELRYNADAISALEGKRQIKYDRMVAAKNAGLITIDEAREELGFDALGGVASQLLVTPNTIPLDDIGLPDEEDIASYNETIPE